MCIIQRRRRPSAFTWTAARSRPFFDLENDPFQFRNLADDAAYAPLVRDYAQRMLSWRLDHAERTLTGYRASPEGLIVRR